MSSVFDALRAVLAPSALSPESFLAARTDTDLVIDVRTPAEFASGHLVGALNLDVSASDFRSRAAALDLTRPVYLYCQSGARSGSAVGILRSLGATQVENIGGIAPLARAGAPVERT